MTLRSWLDRQTEPDRLKHTLEQVEDVVSNVKLARGERPDPLGDLRSGFVSTLVDGAADAAREVLEKRHGSPADAAEIPVVVTPVTPVARAVTPRAWERPTRGALSRAVGEEAIAGPAKPTS